jgi:hypothetical protein
MTLTPGEKNNLLNISKKILELRQFLYSDELDDNSTDLDNWYRYLTKIKCTLGNLNNDVSLIACLMVEEFLMTRHSFNLDLLDVCKKPQSAPGLDIDEVTKDGERVIAEIKTTIPCGKADLGAQQREMFLKDFKKLVTNDAEYKYFFLTEIETFQIIKERYLDNIKGVTLVLLPQGFSDKDYILMR